MPPSKTLTRQSVALADAPNPVPLDSGAVTLAMIQALIPLGLRAVEDALQQEVRALAGARYAREDGRPRISRWGTQPGSIFLADQKLPIAVPRVRDRQARCEVPLATYQQLQTPRTHDIGLFRRVLGGLSCREYEAAAEAVPEAFGLARSSVSRRFIRASAHELRRLQERRLDDAEWLVLVLDGKTFAGENKRRERTSEPSAPTRIVPWPHSPTFHVNSARGALVDQALTGSRLDRHLERSGRAVLCALKCWTSLSDRIGQPLTPRTYSIRGMVAAGEVADPPVSPITERSCRRSCLPNPSTPPSRTKPLHRRAVRTRRTSAHPPRCI